MANDNGAPGEVLVADLVRAHNLYPRARLDGMNVRDLIDALEADVTLPPVAVWRLNNWVSDGFHRCEALTQVYGESATTQVEWCDYANEVEFFEDSARRNVTHGRRLAPHDRALVAHRAQELGITLERIASVLSVNPGKLERRIVLSGPVQRRPGLSGESIVLKRDWRHLEGRPLSSGQVEAHQKSAGMGVPFFASQIKMRIESDSLEWNPRVVEALSQLRDLLNERSELS